MCPPPLGVTNFTLSDTATPSNASGGMNGSSREHKIVVGTEIFLRNCPELHRP